MNIFIFLINSIFNNQKVFNIRYCLGKELAAMENIKLNNKQNILVIGSPDTGIPMEKVSLIIWV